MNLRSGTVVEVHGMLATVLLHDVGGAGERVRCRPPRKRSTPVIGDRVRVRTDVDPAEIAEITPRRRCYVRPIGPYKQRIAAAWTDRLVIVSAVDPPPRTGLIDRILCGLDDLVDGVGDGAEAGGVAVTLVVNKADLDGADAAVSMLDGYLPLGFEVLRTSARTGQGVDALRSRLSEGLVVIVGHSGVGKSSLLNELVPGAALATGDVNVKTRKGRHTTTVSTCHEVGPPWPQGGLLVDTPGIRSFPLHGLPLTELALRFPDFAHVASQLSRCRFGDCLHEREPGCEILQAVDDGLIAASRHAAYVKLLEDLRAERALARR